MSLADRWKTLGRAVGSALVALAAALLLVLVLVAVTSAAPLEAIRALLTAVLSSKRTLGTWIDDAAKLTVAGLAFSLVFQARQFSIGVQGQTYVGGVCAALVALSPLGTTAFAIPLGILAALLAGSAYGFIPGYAKARLGANEIVSSLMLNSIALDVSTWLIRARLAPPGQGLLMTEPFAPASLFPALVQNTRIDLGLVLALVAVVVVWFALYRARWGLKLRLVGDNPAFADYAGIPARAVIVGAMAASGALGGLLGAMFVMGRGFGKLAVQFEGNLAFEGILIAIVARSRPLAVPVVALAYGYLRQGAVLMGIRTDVPAEIIGLVQAAVVLLVASDVRLGGWRRFGRWRRRSRARVEATARPVAPGSAR